MEDINKKIDALKHVTSRWQTQTDSRGLSSANAGLAERNKEKASIEEDIRRLDEQLNSKRKQLARVKGGKESKEDREYFNAEDRIAEYKKNRRAIEAGIKRLKVAAEIAPPPYEATPPKS